MGYFRRFLFFSSVSSFILFTIFIGFDVFEDERVPADGDKEELPFFVERETEIHDGTYTSKMKNNRCVDIMKLCAGERLRESPGESSEEGLGSRRQWQRKQG